MKKLFLILSLLVTAVSSSFGWYYLSASGYNEYGSPIETGNVTYINVNSYYSDVKVRGGISNETPGIGAFCYTYIGSANGSIYYNYGGIGTDGPSFYYSLGLLPQNSTIVVNLEVYGLDTWTTVSGYE